MKKYSHISRPLFAVGWALVVIFRYVFPKSPDWISGTGFLLVTAGLIFLLVGIISERRELEAKRQADTK
jgi:protein-S-isoprenylcysteine O-methyltransferase Ste14